MTGANGLSYKPVEVKSDVKKESGPGKYSAIALQTGKDVQPPAAKAQDLSAINVKLEEYGKQIADAIKRIVGLESLAAASKAAPAADAAKPKEAPKP